MSLWKRGRQYWTDFTVADRRYRKRLGTTNLRVATNRECALIEEAGHGRLTDHEQVRNGSRMRLPPISMPSGCDAPLARSSSRKSD